MFRSEICVCLAQPSSHRCDPSRLRSRVSLATSRVPAVRLVLGARIASGFFPDLPYRVGCCFCVTVSVDLESRPASFGRISNHERSRAGHSGVRRRFELIHVSTETFEHRNQEEERSTEIQIADVDMPSWSTFLGWTKPVPFLLGA